LVLHYLLQSRRIDSLTVYIYKSEKCTNILRYNTCKSTTKYLNKYVRRGFCLIYMFSFYFWSPSLARKMRKTKKLYYPEYPSRPGNVQTFWGIIHVCQAILETGGGRKLSHNGCTAGNFDAARITKYLNKYVRRGFCLIYMFSFYFWSPSLDRKMRKTKKRYKLSHNGCTAAILTYPTMFFLLLTRSTGPMEWSTGNSYQAEALTNVLRYHTTIMAQFSSTSGLQDSLTYMYYTSKCLYMSLLYKYIQ
jgi:hypothetical protein